MPANFIPIGEPAHDPERQALRFLVEGLPADYTVYGNAWLVERSGVIYELDAVVVAPHAVFVVEVKAYRGRIEGTDNDWYIPHPIPSPLKLNRLTAQVLKSLLKRESYQAGQVWVEGLVFLSATTGNQVRRSASKDRIHTRKTILAALQDPALVERFSGRRARVSTAAAEPELLRHFTGVQGGLRPTRRVRGYEILDATTPTPSFSVATTSPAPSAQVLGRLGRSEGILSADPPFLDRFAAALCLFELYAGRHAFEGKVPEPGQKPAVREDDIDPPGLAAFFDKALDPAPERHYPLARAIRDALVVALGDDVDVPAAAAPALEDPCHRRCCPGHRAAPDWIALAEYDDATGDFKGLTLPIQDGPAVVAHASRWPPRPAPLSIRSGGPRCHRVRPRHPQPPRRSRPPAMIPSLSALDTKAAPMRRRRMRSQTSCARSPREVVRHIVSAPDAENISIVLEVSAENSDRFSENIARTARENSRVLSLYNSDFEDVKW